MGEAERNPSYGVMLSKDEDPRNRQRSGFWLRKAAENGNELAGVLLKNTPNN